MVGIRMACRRQRLTINDVGYDHFDQRPNDPNNPNAPNGKCKLHEDSEKALYEQVEAARKAAAAEVKAIAGEDQVNSEDIEKLAAAKPPTRNANDPYGHAAMQQRYQARLLAQQAQAGRNANGDGLNAQRLQALQAQIQAQRVAIQAQAQAQAQQRAQQQAVQAQQQAMQAQYLAQMQQQIAAGVAANNPVSQSECQRDVSDVHHSFSLVHSDQMGN